jgi:hypothetical protein
MSSIFLVFLLPFCIFSIISYAHYSINQRRYERISLTLENVTVKSLLQTKTVLLTYLPAPSLRMLVFDGNGMVLGEIKDEKFKVIRWYLPYFIDRLYSKSYGFYNAEDMLQYIFLIKKDTIEIRNKDRKLVSKITEKKTGKVAKTIYQYQQSEIILTKSLAFTDFTFENESAGKLAKLTKGWMPKDWSNRFMNPNMPILSINHSASNKEIVHVYAILTKLYAYKDH